MKVSMVFVIALFMMMLAPVGNVLQAQPEFATVRLVTTWMRSSTLFISKGAEDFREVDLRQKYCDTKHKDEYQHDNRILNEHLSELYKEGYKLVSTSSSDYPGGGFTMPGREVLFFFVRE